MILFQLERINKNINSGILKFLVQPDRIKQGGTNGVSKNYHGRAGGNISPAL
jgi:hypothetical protein